MTEQIHPTESENPSSNDLRDQVEGNLPASMISRKICLLGDFAVGKTSLVRRFVYETFEDTYTSTMGVKVSRKTVAVPFEHNISELTMMLWDVAGNKEYDQMRASYLRDVSGAILVCDMTRFETLVSLQGYAATLLEINPQAKIIVAANKHDQIDNTELTRGQVEDTAALVNAPYYLTSAKTGDHVEIVFRHLGRLLLP